MEHAKNHSRSEEALAAATDFFSDTFPGAVVNLVSTGNQKCDSRLQEAGLGMAEVIQANGALVHATFVLDDETPTMLALSTICAYEALEKLPPGSHDAAIDSIIDGSFAELYGEFLPHD